MRVALVGWGPLPDEVGSRHSALGIRTSQFLAAVRPHSEALRVFLLGQNGEPEPRDEKLASGGIAVQCLSGHDERTEVELSHAIQDFAPDVVVGATTYASYLASRAAPSRPLWLDLNGDPIAEGQAASRSIASDRPLEDALWMLHWLLRTGDRFSTVSGPQRLALLGQLGAAGRLARSQSFLDLVQVIPESCEVPSEARELPPDAQPRVVLFSGSFNSWIDGESFVLAVERVLRADPSARFVVTGGEIAGFLEAPWERFRARIGALPGPLRDRVELWGWVASEKLREVETHAWLGIVPELRLLERELGGQNRSLRWMARGIPVVMTAQCELGRQVVEHELGLVYEPGDAEGLADRILRLLRDRELALDLGRRARQWVTERRSHESTTRSLVDWLKNPQMAPDRLRGEVPERARRMPQMLLDQLHLQDESSGKPPASR